MNFEGTFFVRIVCCAPGMWCVDICLDNTFGVQSKMAADSGMDTCPSPENPDSRKRPLDGDVENGSTKRSHYAGGKRVN